MTDFSIDYILNRAGEKYIGTNASVGVIQRIRIKSYHPYNNINQNIPTDDMQQNYEQLPLYNWLQYTRYHPPKLPRSLRCGPAKRTPGRLPRIPFTPAQLHALENAYRVSNYLSAEDANKLAASLDLTNTRVKIWFQNRRARERREKRDKEDYYDSTLSSNASSPEPESEQDMVIIE
ncbi:homeobox protein MSX-1 [Teleopsis dalmanni]|uniref:homeobox protein MSX-1 n=1 Tax=Teleopsis dalmanni TaxID=139649 RepID=UPI0018CDB90F|nr:homeobox protein MSX-1 [Teleopsis dalmanni]